MYIKLSHLIFVLQKVITATRVSQKGVGVRLTPPQNFQKSGPQLQNFGSSKTAKS